MGLELKCEDFGLSQDEMLKRLIDTMADRMLGLDSDAGVDDQENPFYSKVTIEARLDQIMKEHIEKRIVEIAEEHVLPKVDDMIVGLTFQETSRYGEPKKPKQTLREWLESRATAWLSEDVDHSGKTKAQDPYNWKKHSSRLLYAVEKHVAWHLNAGIQEATKDLQTTFADQVARLVNQTIKDMKVTTTVNVK